GHDGAIGTTALALLQAQGVALVSRAVNQSAGKARAKRGAARLAADCFSPRPQWAITGRAREQEDTVDLGIGGKKAIICASSKGLGKGCAVALAREGVEVTICARGAEALAQAARELGATGTRVNSVVCDVTTEEGRKALLAACPTPDILINNA